MAVKTPNLFGNRTGQSVIEVLLAVSILTMAFAAAVLVVFGNQFLLADRQFASQAEEMAAEGLEAVKSIAGENFSNLALGDHGLVFTGSDWQFSGTEDKTDIFTRKITVATTTDINIREIKSAVSWQTEPKRTIKIELSYLATNWRGVLASGGDTGGGEVFGNWKNPRTLGTIDLGPGNAATDLDVFNKIVYLTATASDKKKDDFFAVDAHNGQNLLMLSSINTGLGLLSVDVAGNYAYVGNSSTTGQLQVIDISNPSGVFLAATVSLPGVSGSGAVGNTVFYNGGRVYVGTKQAAGPEFHIFDVTNPTNPVWLGSKEIGADVNSIFVENGRAYLATSDDSAELKIFDVNNPASVTLLGSYDAAGANDGKAVYWVGNKIYLGRLGDGNPNDPELYILDVTNPANIAYLGSKKIGSDVNDLRIRDNLAFLATSDSNKEFQVWDISDPANINLWSSFNFPQVATGIDYEDNLVYVSVRSNDALRIITSQ